ncbi:unnamed protein product [Gadus morhua 'NCC']
MEVLAATGEHKGLICMLQAEEPGPVSINLWLLPGPSRLLKPYPADASCPTQPAPVGLQSPASDQRSLADLQLCLLSTQSSVGTAGDKKGPTQRSREHGAEENRVRVTRRAPPKNTEYAVRFLAGIAHACMLCIAMASDLSNALREQVYRPAVQESEDELINERGFRDVFTSQASRDPNSDFRLVQEEESNSLPQITTRALTGLPEVIPAQSFQSLSPHPPSQDPASQKISH